MAALVLIRGRVEIIHSGPYSLTIDVEDASDAGHLGKLADLDRECGEEEAAAELKISYKTADSHRSRVLEKLGVHETASMVRYAIRAGLVEP